MCHRKRWAIVIVFEKTQRGLSEKLVKGGMVKKSNDIHQETSADNKIYCHLIIIQAIPD